MSVRPGADTGAVRDVLDKLVLFKSRVRHNWSFFPGARERSSLLTMS